MLCYSVVVTVIVAGPRYIAIVRDDSETGPVVDDARRLRIAGGTPAMIAVTIMVTGRSSVRQICRTLTTARPEPYISPKAEKERIEKTSAALKILGQKDTETVIVLSGSNLAPDKPVRTRDIAAPIMGVSPRYVQMSESRDMLPSWSLPPRTGPP